MLFSQIQDFVAETILTTDIEDLKAILTKYIKPLGFSMHTCVSVVDLQNPPPSALLLLEFPKLWVERYISENYIESDVVFQKAIRDMRAFTWNELTHFDRTAQKIFSESSEFGIKNGVTVPISIPGYLPATVNVIGEHLDISEEDYHAIHLMAIYYYHSVIRIKRTENNKDYQSIKLTPREKDCLHWIAQGKREPDIADILFISQHTVHSHLESVRKKLDVSTSTQAAVRAVHCGLIVP